MTQTERPIVHHIPVCPFCQRLEILLELKGLRGEVEFRVVDITKPRAPDLLARTRGSSLLPVLETPEGHIVKESLVILNYLEDLLSDPPVAQVDPYLRAVENMLISFEGDFTAAGYRFVMNRHRGKRDALARAMADQYARLDDYLRWKAPEGEFLIDSFGLAEVVFTPIFARFHFLDYFEGFEIPKEFARVRRWSDACLAHPAAQQTSREEIIKVYYDYALGMGNGALAPGRTVSSFALEPHWSRRPWPPRDKWHTTATDADLGLL